MSDAARIAQERVARFERLGGVDLSHLEVEDPLAALVRTGLFEHKKTVLSFKCGVCGNKVASNQEMEPMCTGPSWTDDHPPIVMELVR